MKVEKIAGGIFDSNVFVVGDEKSCVIVDAGVEISDAQKAVGTRTVLGVLLTHGHFDHSYFVEQYAAKFGCKIYAHKNAKTYLENSHHNASDGLFELHDFSDFVFFDADTALKFPNLPIEVFVMGGHSTSDVAYRIGDDIFVGDILIGQSIGRVDLYGGNVEVMKESLKKIESLDFSTLHSGHGCDLDKKTATYVIQNWLK